MQAVDQLENSEIEQLLSLDECTRPRAPQELRDWVLDRCHFFAQRPNLREPVLLRHGRFKPFHEEIYPLSLFAVRRYGDRKDVFFVPNLDQRRDFDAQIKEPSRTFPNRNHFSLRPASTFTYGVPRTAPLRTANRSLTFKGTKRKDRQIGVVLEFVDHKVSRAEHLAFIKTAAEGKKGLGRYGKKYELLIAVEDRWFEPDDTMEIAAFVKQEVLTLPLKFGAVHLIGLTNRLFLSFKVP